MPVHNSSSVICPVHQFEIRYTNVLNFHLVVPNVVAPFAKLSSRVTINNENSHAQQITLHFDTDYYQIIITWDRIIIRVEPLYIDDLPKSGSMINEPFFSLFNKILELPNFGEIKNILFYSFLIKPSPIKKAESAVLNSGEIAAPVHNEADIKNTSSFNYFVNKYLQKERLQELINYDDVGIVLNKVDGATATAINIGPYLGLEDITRRNITITNPGIKELLYCDGEILDFKYIEHTKSVTFRNYKEYFETQSKFITKL